MPFDGAGVVGVGSGVSVGVDSGVGVVGVDSGVGVGVDSGVGVVGVDSGVGVGVGSEACAIGDGVVEIIDSGLVSINTLAAVADLTSVN